LTRKKCGAERPAPPPSGSTVGIRDDLVSFDILRLDILQFCGSAEKKVVEQSFFADHESA
jgi:hypothetical protein